MVIGHFCEKCNGKMEKFKVEREGKVVGGLKCQKCGDERIYLIEKKKWNGDD